MISMRDIRLHTSTTYGVAFHRQQINKPRKQALSPPVPNSAGSSTCIKLGIFRIEADMIVRGIFRGAYTHDTGVTTKLKFEFTPIRRRGICDTSRVAS
ncbi:hypothetical protein CBS147309_3136 [Penicillium roqueforti]|nr:hypothetical protein CBS147309_3136 [Penicillium roqueforti]